MVPYCVPQVEHIMSSKGSDMFAVQKVVSCYKCNVVVAVVERRLDVLQTEEFR